MFDYIVNKRLHDAVDKGYRLCKDAGNYPAFIGFLDKLDLPASTSMRIVADVSTVSPSPKLEGLEKSLRDLITSTGKHTFDTVSIIPGDSGLKELDFKNIRPFMYSFPVVNGQNVCTLECCSVFGRTPASGMSDGNPLIYALKRIKNWRLASAEDFSTLFEYFLRFAEQEFNHGFLKDVDTIIPVPSRANINSGMVSCIQRRIKPEIVTLDMLGKQSVDNAYDQVDDEAIESQIMPIAFPNLKEGTVEYNKAVQSVYTELMASKRKNTDDNDRMGISGNPFSIKFVAPKYRKVFTDYIVGGFPDGMLTGKNVLVVDDTVSTGSSLTHVVSEFILGQNPGSVKGFTLLSPVNK